MIFTLEQVLKLTGTLDDSLGDGSPRERFRAFLREHVGSAGDLRDFVQECRIKPGLQYNRALQDLVNHVGTLLGFDVEFGRYAGVPGQIGHDGLWRSPEGLHVVIEAKTSETYPIKVTTLLGYIDELVAAGKVPSSKEALGLFAWLRSQILKFSRLLTPLSPEATEIDCASSRSSRSSRWPSCSRPTTSPTRTS